MLLTSKIKLPELLCGAVCEALLVNKLHVLYFSERERFVLANRLMQMLGLAGIWGNVSL